MSIKAGIGLGSAAAGIALLVAAADQGLAYSELDNPGALNSMVDLAVASLAFLLVPAAMIATWVVRGLRREIARSGFTPRQVAIGEAVIMAGAAYAWHEHNERVSAALTESVMGPERGADGPWG
jgi:cytochrome bd-type quinol oxidase subunit 2